MAVVGAVKRLVICMVAGGRVKTVVIADIRIVKTGGPENSRGRRLPAALPRNAGGIQGGIQRGARPQRFSDAPVAA